VLRVYLNRQEIIHGDLKPANVLVFKASDGTYIPKVIDFGYSPATSGKTEVKLPRSGHWTHPGYHTWYTIDKAKEMDAYSFGMVCLWLLFYGVKEGGIRDLVAELELKNAMSIAEDALANSNYMF
jgi:serine/threonine protein kinase